MRIPIANLSHLVHILVLETSAGLTMSKANEATSNKAEQLEVYNKRYFRLCSCLLQQEIRNTENLSSLRACTAAAVT